MHPKSLYQALAPLIGMIFMLWVILYSMHFFGVC